MKLALVHDYLYTFGGAERVLEALKEIWPEAPVFTAWVDWPWLQKYKPEWQNWKIITSWFDKVPFKKTLCSPLRFLTPKIWSSFDLSNFDVVISSSAWYMSKGVSLSKLKIPMHICYCHTPPRYLYGYPTSKSYENSSLIKAYAYIVNPFLRCYDYKSSQSVDFFICNSNEVRKRIAKFYRREATVIYPPLALNNNENKNTKGSKDYFLMVNRLVGPKKIDLAIQACLKLKKPLKIVGTGPDEQRLRNIAGRNPLIEFLDFVDNDKLIELYSGCQAVLYLAEQEDFGITPIEAMNFGKPVIVNAAGGVQESVIDGKTGLYLNNLTVNELIKAINRLPTLKIKALDCKNQARKFSKDRFKKEIQDFVEEKYFARTTRS